MLREWLVGSSQTCGKTCRLGLPKFVFRVLGFMDFNALKSKDLEFGALVQKGLDRKPAQGSTVCMWVCRYVGM